MQVKLWFEIVTVIHLVAFKRLKRYAGGIGDDLDAAFRCYSAVLHTGYPAQTQLST